MSKEKYDWEEMGMLYDIDDQKVKDKLIEVYDDLYDHMLSLDENDERNIRTAVILFPVARKVLKEMDDCETFDIEHFMKFCKEMTTKEKIQSFVNQFEGIIPMDTESEINWFIATEYLKLIK